ncbi:MAG: hypothetical protein MUO31_02225 [Thermodesulfovibrionales bacterium]|nr:hypothetical protein [Thermodesulfovibrionales bacterium]
MIKQSADGQKQQRNSEISGLVNIPSPLYRLITLYNNETQSFRKVHRLIDTFEWAIKWHTLLAVSDLIREQQIPDRLKILLAEGLRTPSLGTWMFFYREALGGLIKPSLPYREWSQLKTLEKKHNIVSFRTSYAHGATPTDGDCQADCDKHWPVLLKLIDSSIFFDVRLVAAGKNGFVLLQGASPTPMKKSEITELENILNEPGRTAALLPEGKLLLLWPIGVYAEDPRDSNEMDFFYFNALKDKKIEQLNYEKALRIRNKALWEPFHRVLPLGEWRRITNPDLELFREKVETLTENFKGRVAAQKQLGEFFRNGQGTFFVWGGPGIGKSALLAQVFKLFRAGDSLEGKASLDNPIHLLEYFIRRGTEYASVIRFLRYLNQKLDAAYGLKGLGLGEKETELWEQLQARLNAIGEQDNPAPAMLLVDGLDEHPELRKYIPESRGWLKIMISSRRQPEVEGWARERDRERSSSLELGPLSGNDVRALLYDVVDKYQEGFTAEYVQAVIERSEGNPLYLKLLCDQLFSAGGQVGSVREIPARMTDLYRQTMKRVSNEGKEPEVVTLLCLLAEAKESLSIDVIAEFLALPKVRVESLVDLTRELLYEDPAMPEVDDYQLFHESLREWLRENFQVDCDEMAKCLANCCLAYREIKSEQALKYALAYAAEHLAASGDRNRLWELLRDEEFRKKQVDTFKQYSASYAALKKGVETYIVRDGASTEDDARLCWLALRAGELGQQSETDINAAFEWVSNRSLDDPERMPDALKRLQVLNEKKFFKAVLLLLWIEADRRKDDPEESRNMRDVDLVLDIADKRIPAGAGTVDWSDFLSAEFMVFWIGVVLKVFPLATDSRFFCLVGHIGSDDYKLKMVKSIFAIDFVPTSIDHIILLGLAIVDWIKDDECKSKALIDIATTIAKVDDITNRAALLTKFFSVVEGIKNSEYKSNALAVIGKDLAQDGDVEQARMEFTRPTGNKDDEFKSNAPSALLRARVTALIENLARKRIRSWKTQSLHVSEEIKEDKRWSSVLNTLAETLAQMENVEDAQKGFTQSLSLVKKIRYDEYKSNALTALTTAIAQAGNLPDRKVLFTQILSLVDEIKDNKYKSNALLAVGTAQVLVGDIEHARTVFTQSLSLAGGITDDESKSSVLIAIAQALAQAGDVTRARMVFTQSLSVSDGIKYYKYKSNALIAIGIVLARAGDVEYARTVFIQSLSLVEGTTDDEYKSNALATITSALIHASDMPNRADLFSQTLSMVEGIIDDEHKSNALVSIITALIQSRDMSERADLFSQTLSMVEGIIDDERKSKALAAITTALVHLRNTLDRAALFTHFLHLLERIEKQYYKSENLTSIPSDLVRVQDIQDANALKDYANSILNWSNSEEYSKSKTLAVIGTAMTQAGDMQRAQVVFSHALYLVETFNGLFKSHVLSGIAKAQKLELLGIDVNFSRALFEVAESNNDECRYNTLVAITTALVHSVNIPDCEALFAQSLNLVEATEDVKYKYQALATIVEALTKTGDAERARSIFIRTLSLVEGITDEYPKSNALASITALLVHLENMPNYEALFAHFLSLVEKFKNDEYKSNALAAVIKALVQVENMPDRTTFITQALSIAEGFINSTYKFIALIRIAGALTQTRDLERAQMVLTQSLSMSEGIEKGKYNYAVLIDIGQVMARVGDVEQARTIFTKTLSLVDKITDDKSKSWALNDITKAVVQAGGMSDRAVLLTLSLSLAERLKDDEYKSNTLIAITNAIAKAGDISDRATLFNYSLSLTERLKDDEHKSKTLVAITKAIVQAGDMPDRMTLFTRSLSIVDGVKDDKYKSNTLSDITTTLVKIGLSSLIINTMNSVSLTAPVWQRVISDWREVLLKMDVIPLSQFCHSFNYIPFHSETSYHGVYAYLQALYASQQFDVAQSVIRQCPQLGLDFLLKESKKKCTLANLEEWIETIADEDLQDKITGMSARVKKGKMTEEEFDRKLSSLLGN